MDGTQAVSQEVQAHAGINRWFWDLRLPPSAAETAEFEARMEEMRARGGGAPGGGFRMRGAQGSTAPAGTYLIRLTVDGQMVEGTLAVRDDPGLEGVLPSVR